MLEINPGPPTANDEFTNYTLTVTLPDGTTENVSDFAAESPFSLPLGGNIVNDAVNFTRGAINPITNELNFTGEIGAYTLKVDFLGQMFGNGVYYMPSENKTSFDSTVMTPGPTQPPTPTSTPN